MMHAVSNTTRMDPISASIIWSRLCSLADDTAAALIRTSFSVMVREINDLTQIITDDLGRTLGQSTVSSPGFVGTTGLAVQYFKRQFGDDWKPGDVAITNDPWIVTGHLPDTTIVTPVFKRGRIVAFVANTVHLADIGGTYFGVNTSEIFEEGLRIPPLKIRRPSGMVDDVWSFIRANVRVPDLVEGDIRAQIAANDRAADHVVALLDEHDLEDLRSFADTIIDASDQALGSALSQLPEGTFESEIAADGYGTPFRIKVKLTVRAGRLHWDFAGTDAQQKSPINAVLQYTAAYVGYVTKCVFAPDVPNNEGILRRISITAPTGSIVNAAMPAPVQSRHVVGCVLQGLLLNALAKCAPEKAQADSGTPPAIITFYGDDKAGRPFVSQDFINGGIGARSHHDGRSATSYPTNLTTIPIEVHETIAPVLYTQQCLIPGSGGEGKFRGGLGQRKSLRALLPMKAAVIFDRFDNPPHGVLGGSSGRAAAVWVDGKPIRAIKSVLELAAGAELTVESAGGGGMGNPAEREQALRDHDVAEGYVVE